jgi:hypothetical protein
VWELPSMHEALGAILLAVTSHSSPPIPWQPSASFLSLHVCLFWTFHKNGVIKSGVFCAWLLSFSITFLGSPSGGACTRLPSFLWLNHIPGHEHATLCLTAHGMIDIKCFLPWGCYEWHVHEHSQASFEVDIYFQFSGAWI